MNTPQLCPDCGCEIPVGSPAGMCPKCMLQAGFESQPPEDPRFQATAPSPQAKTNFVPPSPDELAKLFPQLEILELLGQGGMGAVYKARQKGLDRLVAVKILPPEIGRDPAFAERFTREARALAKLNHPNIVSVYDFGDVAGQFYFLMEFVDGVNLRQAIRGGQITPQECLAIVPQICDALQFAHDEGVVHRDIKPENILLDKKGRVKIADFGLAKLLGQDTTDHTLTGTNQVMGTMRYMAPEQMFGSKLVDHRADIYSLGVVFYELLTGEVPVGRFAAPSKKVQIDVRLDEVVLRALEREPEQRYQQASEVRDDLKSVMENQPMKSSDETEAVDPVQKAREWANEITIPSIALLASTALTDRISKWLGISGGYEPLLLWFALLAICNVGISRLYHYFYFGSNDNQHSFALFNTATPTRFFLLLSLALGLFACVTPAEYTERGLWGMGATSEDSNGVWVMGAIEPFSVAEQIGIKRNDLIYTVDGHIVESHADLDRVWRQIPVGKNIEIQVWRNPNGAKAETTHSSVTIPVIRPPDTHVSRFYWHWQLLAGIAFVVGAILSLTIKPAFGVAWRGWVYAFLFSAIAVSIFVVPWKAWAINAQRYGLDWQSDWIQYTWQWWAAFAAAIVLATLGIMEIIQSPRRKVSAIDSEPRLSRLALAGAIWTPALWTLFTIGIISLVVYAESQPGEGNLKRNIDPITTVIGCNIILFSALGTTITGAIALVQIRRSNGKLYGARLALVELLLFPCLLLNATIIAGMFLPRMGFNTLLMLVMSPALLGVFIGQFFVIRSIWRWGTGWQPPMVNVVKQSYLAPVDHTATALPQLLGVAMGLVLGLFCMTIGFLLLPEAFMFAEIGSGPFWGLMGGAFGCLFGGLSCIAGSWNRYRQLRGETDWLQSPTWTGIDPCLLGYGVFGLLLLTVAPLLSAMGGWNTLENPLAIHTLLGAWLLGGLMIFQAVLFMLWRSGYLLTGSQQMADQLVKDQTLPRHASSLKLILWFIVTAAILVFISFRWYGSHGENQTHNNRITVGAIDPWLIHQSHLQGPPAPVSIAYGDEIMWDGKIYTRINALTWSFLALAIAIVAGSTAWRMDRENSGKAAFDAQWWRKHWNYNGYFLAFYFLVVLLNSGWKSYQNMLDFQQAHTVPVLVEQDPAVDSAKAVAETFLSALFSTDGNTAFALISDSYRERLTKEQAEKKQLVFHPQWTTSFFQNPTAIIEETQVLDNKNQVAIRGRFHCNQAPHGEFRIIMAKDAKTSQWLVDTFTSSGGELK